jgi:hypothetical protein
MSEESLAQYYLLVENSIKGLNVDPVACRGEKPGQWSYSKGKATIWIDVWQMMAPPNKSYFQVMSPIMEVPSAGLEDFYKELLEINYDFYAVGFVKKDKWIYIKTIREVENLEQSEVNAMLDRVGYYADDWISKLKYKYVGDKNA